MGIFPIRKGSSGKYFSLINFYGLRPKRLAVCALFVSLVLNFPLFKIYREKPGSRSLPVLYMCIVNQKIVEPQLILPLVTLGKP